MGQFLKVQLYLCTPMSAYNSFVSLVGGKSLIIYEKPIFLRIIIIIIIIIIKIIVLPSFPIECDIKHWV